MDDVWVLESREELAACDVLASIATDAFEGKEGAQSMLEDIWNESWDSIKSKLEVEGSTWYVWWMDGVRTLAQMLKEV